MLAWALGLAHSLAFIAAIMNPLSWWVKVLLAAVIFTSLCFNFRHFVSQPAVRLILRRPDGEWLLTLKDGSSLHGKLQGSTLVTVWFTLLHLRTDAGLQAVLLCRDSLDHESYRLLRVLLRIDAVIEPL